MRVLRLEKPGTLEWRETAEPAAAANEALVRVRRCGVCGTDMHAFAGTQPLFSYPRVLGHELCVEVITAPVGSGLKPGDLCAVEAYYFCGVCPPCRVGRTNACKNLKVLGVHLDAGHAPLMAVPTDKLHPAKSLSPDQIALVEPLVIGAHAIERGLPTAGEPTLILGMGPIGLAVAIFAKAAGANVACADTQPHRISFACETMRLGAPFQADANLDGALQKHFGQSPSLVIDATGNAASMKATFKLAEHGGRIVLVGLFIGDMTFDDANYHRRELTLMASRCGLTASFRDVIRMMEATQVDVMPLITHRFHFSETAERLPEIHREPGLVKAMIDFDARDSK
jgi:2-desacetyl-2-hydroxyethyl bacteriochlorophyllide A dehydrogenase